MHKTVVEMTCSAAALVVNRNGLGAGCLQGLSSISRLEPGCLSGPVHRLDQTIRWLLMLRFFQLLSNFGFFVTHVA